MISDGQRVNAAVVNAALMSRTANTSTTGKLDLLNDASPEIEDVQLEINKSRLFIGAEQEVGAGAEISINPAFNQLAVVKGDGPQTASSTPFGSTTPFNGMEVTIIGSDSTNTLKIVPSDESKGCAMNGSITIKRFTIITFRYIQPLDRYVEVSRNFL